MDNKNYEIEASQQLFLDDEEEEEEERRTAMIKTSATASTAINTGIKCKSMSSSSSHQSNDGVDDDDDAQLKQHEHQEEEKEEEETQQRQRDENHIRQSPREKVMLCGNNKNNITFNSKLLLGDDVKERTGEGEPEKGEPAKFQNTMAEIFASETSTKPIEVKMHREEITDAIGTTKVLISNSESSLVGKS